MSSIHSPFMRYDPFNWHWIIGDDETRFWSSATASYIGELPPGAGVTRIACAADLVDVLAVYGLPGPPDTSLAGVRTAKLAAIGAEIEARLAAGAPFGGLRIALDDGSRADMTAMGTTAIAAASGALPWPESYARGWIARENVRIELTTPADGLGLAAAVGDHYAALRQHGRDLKDLAEAAETVADLDAIDVTAGWPG